MHDARSLRSSLPSLAVLLEEKPEYAKFLDKLADEGSSRVFPKYLAKATPDALSRFFEEAVGLDFDHIRRHRHALANPIHEVLTAKDLEAVKADPSQYERRAEDAADGLRSIRDGRWAVLIFAGGAGTRFNSRWEQITQATPSLNERMRRGKVARNDPKGVFPISPVEGLSFYQRFIAEVLETGVSFGRLPPILIMTSHVTHDRTEEYLAEAELWSLPSQAVFLFRQDRIPRLDHDGDLLARSDGSLIWTGNGHGGVFGALAKPRKNGLSVAERVASLGVKHIIMGNVDNTAFSPLWPERLGYHLRTKADFTLSVVKRSDPKEKVGMACRRKTDGRIEVIEYSVLDPELSAAPDPAGGLLFDAAHINTNLLRLSALRTDLPGTLYTGKPVAVGCHEVDSSTFEMLNQHLCARLDPERIRLYEGERREIFMPTKALIGEDSVQTTFALETARAAREIAALGGEVAGGPDLPQAWAEFHPCLGATVEEKRARGIGKGWRLEQGSRLYLCVRRGLGEIPPFAPGLQLGENSTFILRCERPYGRLTYHPDNRTVAEHVISAGKVRVGANVRIAAGARVVLDVLGDGRLAIPDGAVFHQGFERVIAPGEIATLTGA
ncbi:MAG: hypothetical protein C4523_01365 [Myxococcales bacterium]|nr:MAG: hypothetical protein C4523_01365 [Myxococcales bacterium]